MKSKTPVYSIKYKAFLLIISPYLLITSFNHSALCKDSTHQIRGNNFSLLCPSTFHHFPILSDLTQIIIAYASKIMSSLLRSKEV